MKSKNTFGIQFVLRLPKTKKDEMATVYARITVNGRRTEISLKSKVLTNNWDEVKERVKGKRAFPYFRLLSSFDTAKYAGYHREAIKVLFF